MTIRALPRKRVYDDLEVRRANDFRLHARTELEKVCQEKYPKPSETLHEIQRRLGFMERVFYWANKPHSYVTSLDSVGSMCDLCWASADAWQHLLHPIAQVKTF